ncbi:hypothetical protein [Methyloligella solikamskensis]|uniref:Uncharacterized protein n=1 Tax=Methyloligella solikamskensis TaxID=1177756 RepID=A0ABW3J704_9HYPH
MSNAKPNFSSLDLPKADDDTLDAYAKSRGVPTLTRKTKPRAPSVTIRTDVPDYLAQAMRIEAAKSRSTLRYLILKALKNDGWKIEDGDIVEDGRRPSASN